MFIIFTAKVVIRTHDGPHNHRAPPPSLHALLGSVITMFPPVMRTRGRAVLCPFTDRLPTPTPVEVGKNMALTRPKKGRSLLITGAANAVIRTHDGTKIRVFFVLR